MSGRIRHDFDKLNRLPPYVLAEVIDLMKSVSDCSGTLRRSPPAIATEYWWIGYAGSWQSTTSPGPMVMSTKWERPSFAPMTAIASPSGSMSTPWFRSYHSLAARRRFGTPRDDE